MSPGTKQECVWRRHVVRTSIEREKRRGGIGDRTFWLAAAAIAGFNVLLVAWVLFQPAGPRASQIVANAGAVISPLLVLPLCFWRFREAPETGERSATGRRSRALA